MTDELSAREHDDMRDLLIAGTQRIRPAASHRARLSAGVAALLVAGTVAGVTATVFYTERQNDAPANPSPTPVLTEEVQPTPIAGEGEVIRVPTGGEVTRLPAVFAPTPGSFLALPPDPVLNVRVLLGSGVWMVENGIDSGSAQGFQSVGAIHPWTADLQDGSGRCILIKSDYAGGGWSDVVCDAEGLPATLERELDGQTLVFTIGDHAVDVYAVPR
jgi:hypothetical protein